MDTIIHRITKSPRQRCEEAYDLAGYLLRCKERLGHGGMHFADVTINGVASEMGWRSDPTSTQAALPPPKSTSKRLSREGTK